MNLDERAAQIAAPHRPGIGLTLSDLIEADPDKWTAMLQQYCDEDPGGAFSAMRLVALIDELLKLPGAASVAVALEEEIALALWAHQECGFQVGVAAGQIRS